MLNYYDLQKAIYEKLIANSGLMAQVSGIYDNVPQETSYPFISFGRNYSKKYDVLGKNGLEQKLDIEIWSREGGKKQSAYIMESVYSLLHNAEIVIAGHNLISMEVISTSINLESDGCTYHGIISLRVILSFS
jgi:hypothetical protein